MLTRLVILLFFLNYPLFGQQSADAEPYKWYDQLIGQTNSGVFKGIRYTNEYRTINEKHQFFKTIDFRTGSVGFNGQDYFELLLRYDVYLDELLVVNDALPNKPILVLDKEGVTNFTLDGHSFDYLQVNSSEEIDSGFYEVLFNLNSCLLYKKYRQKIYKRTDAQNLYYEFKDSHSYVLYSGGKYFAFKKTKELNRVFPQYKKNLRLIEKEHDSLEKSDTDEYIQAVLTDLLSLKSMPKKNAP